MHLMASCKDMEFRTLLIICPSDEQGAEHCKTSLTVIIKLQETVGATESKKRLVFFEDHFDDIELPEVGTKSNPT